MLPSQKPLFSLPSDVHYLNCAYMSPLLREVEQAGMEGIRGKQAPHRIAAEDFFAPADAVRAAFSRLIGVEDPQRIALVGSVSYGLSTAARNLPIGPGQEILVLEEQFPSNVLVWRRRAAETGAQVATVSSPEAREGRGRRWNDHVLEAISQKTAIIALPQVHWADGTLFDLAAIGARAREVGAALVVDGTQSIGAYPFDVAAIQPDAVVCAGYKWLMGPYSTGLAYFGPRFDDGVPLEENWINRRGSEQFGGLVRYTEEYQPGALRYDIGERSNFILLPMLLAGLAQVSAWGTRSIQEYTAQTMAPAIRHARSLGCFIEEETWRGHHLFGLRLPDNRPVGPLAGLLRERHISVSVRGSAIRISPHVYNEPADAEALADALSAFFD